MQFDSDGSELADEGGAETDEVQVYSFNLGELFEKDAGGDGDEDDADDDQHQSVWIYVRLSDLFGTETEREFCSELFEQVEHVARATSLGEVDGSGFGFGFGDVSLDCADAVACLDVLKPVLDEVGLPAGSYAKATIGDVDVKTYRF